METLCKVVVNRMLRNMLRNILTLLVLTWWLWILLQIEIIQAQEGMSREELNEEALFQESLTNQGNENTTKKPGKFPTDPVLRNQKGEIDHHPQSPANRLLRHIPPDNYCDDDVNATQINLIFFDFFKHIAYRLINDEAYRQFLTPVMLTVIENMMVTVLSSSFYYTLFLIIISCSFHCLCSVCLALVSSPCRKPPHTLVQNLSPSQIEMLDKAMSERFDRRLDIIVSSFDHLANLYNRGLDIQQARIAVLNSINNDVQGLRYVPVDDNATTETTAENIATKLTSSFKKSKRPNTKKGGGEVSSPSVSNPISADGGGHDGHVDMTFELPDLNAGLPNEHFGSLATLSYPKDDEDDAGERARHMAKAFANPAYATLPTPDRPPRQKKFATFGKSHSSENVEMHLLDTSPSDDNMASKQPSSSGGAISKRPMVPHKTSTLTRRQGHTLTRTASVGRRPSLGTMMSREIVQFSKLKDGAEIHV